MENIEKLYQLKLERDILRSRNVNINIDRSWYLNQKVDFAVKTLDGYLTRNNKKIEKLNKKIARVRRKIDKLKNKGQHVANPNNKEKN